MMRKLFALVFLLSLLSVSQGAVSANETEIMIGTQEEAGSPTTFTIQPKDQSSLPLNQPNLPFQTSFFLPPSSYPSSPISLSPSPSLDFDSSSGIYSVGFLLQEAGDYLLSVTLSGEEVGGGPFPFLVTPGPIDLSKSSSQGGGSSGFVNAGEMNQLVYTFRDFYENHVLIPDSELVFVVSGSYYEHQIINDENTFIFQTNQTGTIQLNITASLYNVNIGFEIDVFPGPFEASTSRLEFYPTEFVAGVQDPLKLYPKDLYGNSLVPGLVSNNPDAFQVVFHRLDSNSQRTSLNFTFFSDFDSNTISDSTYYVISVSPFTLAGNYSVEIIREGNHIFNSPFDLKVSPGPLSSLSELVGDFSSTLSPGVPYSFDIIGKDDYGNRRETGGLSENFLIEFFTNTHVISPTLVDNSDGTYTIPVEFDQTGDYTLDVYYFEDIIRGSGRNLVVFAPSSPQQTTAFGAGLRSCKVGSICRFVVQVRDAYGTNQTNSGDELAFFLGGKELEVLTQVDLGEGNVAIEYKGRSGRRLGITLNGEEISGSPFSVYMAPSDGATGVIVALVILVVVFLLLLLYIFYKRRQVAKLRKEWELKKAMAYKEYQGGGEGEVLKLSEMMKETGEAEWEDDDDEEGSPSTKAPHAIEADWVAMLAWFD